MASPTPSHHLGTSRQQQTPRAEARHQSWLETTAPASPASGAAQSRQGKTAREKPPSAYTAQDRPGPGKDGGKQTGQEQVRDLLERSPPGQDWQGPWAPALLLSRGCIFLRAVPGSWSPLHPVLGKSPGNRSLSAAQVPYRVPWSLGLAGGRVGSKEGAGSSTRQPGPVKGTRLPGCSQARGGGAGAAGGRVQSTPHTRRSPALAPGPALALQLPDRTETRL